MPGRRCPSCGQQTYYIRGRSGKCTNCGYGMEERLVQGGEGSALIVDTTLSFQGGV
jgi:uncharacterized OB-fold protein